MGIPPFGSRNKLVHRILEPELMTDAVQCQAYAAADFAWSNQAFVEIVQDLIEPDATILDLGCGPADVMIRLALARPLLNITAVDGSPAMIQLATEAIAACGLTERISAIEGYIPGLPLRDGTFDAVLSKDFLHHLPDPSVLWLEIRRLVKPRGRICVMDLRRPESPEAARAIVDRVARNEPDVLQFDFFNSLCAAFTPDEIREQLQAAELELTVTEYGDRHVLIQGIAGLC